MVTDMDWHPIRSAEDLPKEDGDYLVTKRKFLGATYTVVESYWTCPECWGTYNIGDKVIAWMPLPAPYRPEKEEAK
jgi:hypothetical protein